MRTVVNSSKVTLVLAVTRVSSNYSRPLPTDHRSGVYKLRNELPHNVLCRTKLGDGILRLLLFQNVNDFSCCSNEVGAMVPPNGRWLTMAMNRLSEAINAPVVKSETNSK